jgi:nucleoid DNA-binding protein
VTFNELIAAVAEDAKTPKSKVSRILRSFIQVARIELMTGGDVRLREFGLLYGTKVKPGRTYMGMEPVKKYVLRFREAEHKRRK